MSLRNAGVIAGMVSTALFVASYVPMLAKARRTRDLSSYSPANLAVANIGNVVHTVYVVSLPVGPIWALHGFYLASSAIMLGWWLRYRGNHDEGHSDRVTTGHRTRSAASAPSPASAEEVTHAR